AVLTQDLLNRIAEKGGWPVSKSLSFTIQDEKARDVLINGKPIDPSKTYNIATNDYIANGGDNCDFLIDAPRTSTGLLVRDVLIQNLRRKVNLNPDFELRIKK